MDSSKNKDEWETLREYVLFCDKKNQDEGHIILRKTTLDEKTKKEIAPAICLFKLKCECGIETLMVGYEDGTCTYYENAVGIPEKGKYLAMNMEQFLTEVNK